MSVAMFDKDTIYTIIVGDLSGTPEPPPYQAPIDIYSVSEIGEMKQITNNEEKAAFYNPAFSPDGKYMSYFATGHYPGEDSYVLHIANADGKNDRVVLNSIDPYWYSWSPSF